MTNEQFDTLVGRLELERHGLSGDALADLRAQLRAVAGLRKAHFVMKRVQDFAHRPCYVLGFSVTGPFRLPSKKRTIEVLRRIQQTVRFPGKTLIVNVDGDHYRFGRKFRWMRGTGIL